MPDLAASTPVPIGAELSDPHSVHVRVWPRRPAGHRRHEGGARAALAADDAGYFSGRVAACAGDLYQFQNRRRREALSDPASRFQPKVRTARQKSSIRTVSMTDGEWTGVSRERQVVYEMHIGTFTPAGTWAAAMNELPGLARLGITVVEVMPVAEFEGRFGWGYDGVDLFAPSHVYGRPDDFRRFVDAAHAAGLAVILDVVYNHFGPSGNYLRAFAPAYFTDRYPNEWASRSTSTAGMPDRCATFFVCNAGYWIDEFC